MQLLVLADLGAVFGQLGQATVVDLAQFGGVLYGIEVTDYGPGPFEPVFQRLDRLHQGFKGRLFLLGDRLDLNAIVAYQLVDRRLDVL